MAITRQKLWHKIRASIVQKIGAMLPENVPRVSFLLDKIIEAHKVLLAGEFVDDCVAW